MDHHDEKEHINKQLDVNSKAIYINYLTNILETNGLSYTSFAEHRDIDELMSLTCSLYNRLKRNKVMYLLEDRDEILFDDEQLENDDEQEEEEVELIKEEFKYEEPNIKDIEHNLEPLVENFRKIRTYKKVLKTLCDNRIKALGAVYIKTYTELLMKHIQSILSICEEKQYTKKKTAECFELTLTGMDFRLIAYHTPRCQKGREGEIQEYVVEKVSNTSLEVEELVYFKNGLEKTQYRGSNLQKIIKNFFNYGSAVITMKELIHMYINDKTQLIYLEDKDDSNEVDKDPFRFYYISRETNKKRYWEMDCRLDDFVRSLIKNVGLYLVDLFRRIYSDMFQDNTYRETFITTPIMRNDCEQLLKNLCLLCRYSSISHLVRDHVRTNFIHKETDRDVFVLRSDDVLMKHDLEERYTEVDYGLIIMLFDDLKPEAAANLFSYYE